MDTVIPPVGPGPVGPPRVAMLAVNPIFDDLGLCVDLGVDLSLVCMGTPGTHYVWWVLELSKKSSECDGLSIQVVDRFTFEENCPQGVS